MVTVTKSKLSRYLDVQSDVDPLPMKERIVYTDWLARTSLSFTITQTGYVGGAQRDWKRLGITPWAWRYEKLTDVLLPRFTIVLNREAKIRIVLRSGNLKIDINTEEDLHENRILFTEVFHRYDHKYDYIEEAYAYPRLTILRPQFRFSPITQRPDRILELVSEAEIYFPRNKKTAEGFIRTQPIKSADPKELKKQVAGYRKSERTNRVDSFINQPIKGSEYTITSHGNGHTIRSVEGEYQFDIIPDYKSGSNVTPAYNFRFQSTPNIKIIEGGQLGRVELYQDIVRLYVHCTEAVKIKQTINTSGNLDAKVYVRRENQTNRVGYLGDPLPFWGFAEYDKGGNAAANILLGVASAALVLIPVWGWIASLALTVGELVYTYHTGKDFFGEEVSPNELAALGIIGIFGAAGDILGGIRSLHRTIISLADDLDVSLKSAFQQIAHEYEAASSGSLAAIENVGENPIAKIIASFNDAEQQTIIAAAHKLRTADEYLRTIAGLLDQQIRHLETTDVEKHRMIFISLLDQFLTPSGEDFANEFLRKAYRKFLENPNTKTARDPIVWLATHNSRLVDDFLKSAMSPNYRSLIQAAIKVEKGQRIVMATSENIRQVYAVYDAIVRLGLAPYKELRSEWRKAIYDDVRGLMKDCFQLEHPVELRFAQNLTGREKYKVVRGEGKDVEWKLEPNPEGIDVQQEFHAFIVPRTVRHAKLLETGAESGELKMGSALLYTQHPKTGRVRARIPHGAEHLATPQEMADAVCAELLRVNFDNIGVEGAIDDIMERLEQDFETLTYLINRARGETFKVPVLIRDLKDINPALVPGAKGWPRFERNQYSGNYATIVNYREVETARREREAWAETRR